mgnify:CR=1 FL=1
MHSARRLPGSFGSFPLSTHKEREYFGGHTFRTRKREVCITDIRRTSHVSFFLSSSKSYVKLAWFLTFLCCCPCCPIPFSQETSTLNKPNVWTLPR